MKTYVITGITGAIGKATAKELAAAKHHLILIGRNRQKLDSLVNELKTSTSNPNIEALLADFDNLSSIRKAAAHIREHQPKIDGLINIAAAYRAKRELTKDGLEYMFGVNHMAVFLLTKELLPLLNASPGARVLTVSAPSSTALNFDDLKGDKKYSPLNAFGASKMANHLFSYALSRKMTGHGNASIVFHPGLIKSDLIREMPGPLKFLLNLISGKPEKPARAIARIMTSDAIPQPNGKFFDSSLKELKPPGYSADRTVQDKLWNVSEALLG
jgi:NAD(P)-dependent dehydrogenase (short-subunit alcohol dehydrogenase family)